MLGQPSIKFLVDESIEYQIVLFLRESGFDVVAITEENPGVSDLKVLNLGNQQQRVLITNDKGFSYLVFKEMLTSSGIILIRMPFCGIEEKTKRLKQAINSKSVKSYNLFVTVTLKRIRYKFLPSEEKKLWE